MFDLIVLSCKKNTLLEVALVSSLYRNLQHIMTMYKLQTNVWISFFYYPFFE